MGKSSVKAWVVLNNNKPIYVHCGEEPLTVTSAAALSKHLGSLGHKFIPCIITYELPKKKSKTFKSVDAMVNKISGNKFKKMWKKARRV